MKKRRLEGYRNVSRRKRIRKAIVIGAGAVAVLVAAAVLLDILTQPGIDEPAWWLNRAYASARETEPGGSDYLLIEEIRPIPFHAAGPRAVISYHS